MFARFAAWLRKQGVVCSENAPLAPHLNFGIGGAVSLLVSCSSRAQLLAVFRKLVADELPYLLLGGGTNIAFPDGLTRAAVVLVPAPPSPGLVCLPDSGSLQVDGGMRNQPFLAWCAANGAGGLEFLSGIPGTLGGAAAVNAGAFGRSLADMLLGADIVDEQGEERAVGAEHFGFRYRESRLKFANEAVLALRLRFSPDEGAAVADRVKKNLEYRLRHHPPYRLASAGCFFKNPLQGGTKLSAGKIIEECGLKGTAVGGLAVAEEHGNFLVNRGQGTFADLRRLEEAIREAVAARTGIVMEREVIYVSPEGKKY